MIAIAGDTFLKNRDRTRYRFSLLYDHHAIEGLNLDLWTVSHVLASLSQSQPV